MLCVDILRRRYNIGGSGGAPSNINKGPGHVAIDYQLNYQEEGRYVRRSAIRAALANPTNDYVDLLRSVFHVPETVIRYVAYHWYYPDINAPQVWWKDKQPVAPIFRQSLIEAIDLAGDLPIDTYWLPIGYRAHWLSKCTSQLCAKGDIPARRISL